jgi:hypothetical protein
MLIGAKRLALISGLSADRRTLRPFSFLLLSPPGSLLRLMLTLLAALRLGPGAQDTAAPTSRHGSSPEEHYDHDQAKAPESAGQQQPALSSKAKSTGWLARYSCRITAVDLVPRKWSGRPGWRRR